jgi:hypothetical protein
MCKGPLSTQALQKTCRKKNENLAGRLGGQDVFINMKGNKPPQDCVLDKKREKCSAKVCENTSIQGYPTPLRVHKEGICYIAHPT